ncbi:MAG: ABC transporter ATP-binding protein, partial [Lutibacter sp.]
GKNGAGKSTLLKILSKITGPTTGSIKSKGRVASLLEVGTGFHGEMTGRENIFLNGAILGMTKKEIAGKLDEIIEFSGCERYIDTPVKRYSSGMTVRLAFAVAAFLEPDILIIDEVLAVGDAEFQKKAIGKMQEISAGGGRTVLFVSHNMAAVKSLCTRGIVLENGEVVFEGNTNDAVNYYINESKSETLYNKDLICKINSNLEIDLIKINNSDIGYTVLKSEKNEINIEIQGVLKENTSFEIEARFFDDLNNPIAFFSPGHYNGRAVMFSKGKFSIERKIILPITINKGKLYMSLFLTLPGKEVYLELKPDIVIEFEGVKMNTGWVFEIEKAGLIFLK